MYLLYNINAIAGWCYAHYSNNIITPYNIIDSNK